MSNSRRWVEFSVGLLMTIGVGALLFLAFQVTDFSNYSTKNTYPLFANFRNVGGLKPRAPVRVAGVHIGSVRSIELDAKTFSAHVTMDIDERYNQLPVDSQVSILTEGLLGANYISLEAGAEVKILKPGDTIHHTYSAMILEELIGKFLVNSSQKDTKGKS